MLRQILSAVKCWTQTPSVNAGIQTLISLISLLLAVTGWRPHA